MYIKKLIQEHKRNRKFLNNSFVEKFFVLLDINPKKRYNKKEKMEKREKGKSEEKSIICI